MGAEHATLLRKATRKTYKQEDVYPAGPRALPETEQWSFEERLKYALVPPWLYVRYRAWKELRSGEAEAALLPLLVNRNRNAVDAGANKGTYTHLLSRLCRHVHAFEPYPKMLRILRRTARSNVSVVPVALSDIGGTAVFRVPRHRKGRLSNQGGSLSAVKVDGPHVAFEVSTARFDDLEIDDVGFMKIDVEGSELRLLDGARNTIARDRPTLLIEIEEAHTGIPLEESVAHVRAMGYAAYFYDRAAHCLRSYADLRAKQRHLAGRGAYVFNFIFLPER